MTTELEKNMARRFTVGDILRRNARHAPEKIALVEKRGTSEYPLNYQDFNNRVNRFAAALRALRFKN